MENDATVKGLSQKQKNILSGMGAYATHYNVSYGDWQANRIMFKNKIDKKKPVFVDYKK